MKCRFCLMYIKKIKNTWVHEINGKQECWSGNTACRAEPEK